MEYGERVIDRVRVRTALDGAMPRRVHFTSLFGAAPPRPRPRRAARGDEKNVNRMNGREEFRTKIRITRWEEKTTVLYK